MTTRYVVDSDIFGVIQRAKECLAFQGCGMLPVIVTDVVWDELTADALAGGARQSTVDEMSAMLNAIAGKPTLVEPETPAAESFARLHPANATEDVGEHSVMALALHTPDCLAVLNDRRAVHRAVDELRGRVLSVHGFLGALRQAGKISDRLARSVSRHYCSVFKPTVPPLWW